MRINKEPSVYDTINEGGCLKWPSEDARARGGKKAWGQWRPKQGDIGTVLGASRHCMFAIDMYILDIGGHIAAVPQYQTKPDL